MEVRDVQRAADRGLRSAIDCSISHWKDMRDWIGPFGDLQQINNENCALCHYQDNVDDPTTANCSTCPLARVDWNCYDDDSVYDTCRMLYHIEKFRETRSIEWVDACNRMLDKLYECYEFVTDYHEYMEEENESSSNR